MKKLIAFVLCLFSMAAIFAGTMDARVRNVPEKISSIVFRSPKENLKSLVDNLTDGVSNDEEKVKLIHDWICDNIQFDAQMYFSGKNSKQDYINVIKKKAALSSGYAAVMKEMCSLAGVECVSIKGWSKGLGYSGKLEKKPDHDWNAVRIGNEWKLVDVGLDAGIVEVRSWIKQYSSEWFFLAPEYFIYSHLPEDSSYQYLSESEIRTKDQFVKEPYISGKFFEYGFSLAKNIPLYNTTISGETEYEFFLNPDTTVTSEIRDKNQNDVKNASWINRSGNKLSFIVDVPDSAEYSAMLFAKKSDEDNYGFKFGIRDYEGTILPGAEALAADGEITSKELRMFKESFIRIKENDAYYIKEDVFAQERNDTLVKIFELLELNPRNMETVLEFNVKADSSYKGFGRGVVKYPTAYNVYNNSTGTKLVSPVCGKLQKGEEVTFVVESTDFSYIAIDLDGSIVNFDKKSDNRFELKAVVSNDKTLKVYGSNNGRNYEGLWYYEVK